MFSKGELKGFCEETIIKQKMNSVSVEFREELQENKIITEMKHTSETISEEKKRHNAENTARGKSAE